MIKTNLDKLTLCLLQCCYDSFVDKYDKQAGILQQGCTLLIECIHYEDQNIQTNEDKR